ncbi:MAG: DNA repair protein RecO [Pirellulaceae bacterium]|nr:DNA repair protein RecO [Planctomycetales bacterium]MCA9220415.1 DNA repair protein RecO [Planctomycetales bacterium]
MSSEKSTGLVLRVVDFSESSCIVTLFTRDFGKISALAKGGRRPKSPFESAIDLLSVIRVVFLHKSSESLDLLTEAKLERRFRAAQRDLSRLYAGFYLAELLSQLTDEADPHPELFDAAAAALEALDGEADVAATVLRFELTALRELGHLPMLKTCAGCGRDMPETPRVAFGHAAGGMLCSACRVGHRQVVSLGREAWETLLAFADPLASPAAIAAVPARVRGEVRGVINQYVCHLLGHRPRMHSYLGVLAN